jgi:hypothetical protein
LGCQLFHTYARWFYWRTIEKISLILHEKFLAKWSPERRGNASNIPPLGIWRKFESPNFFKEITRCMTELDEQLGRAGHSLLLTLIAIPLFQFTITLSLLRYFSKFCNTLFAINYFLWQVWWAL